MISSVKKFCKRTKISTSESNISSTTQYKLSRITTTLTSNITHKIVASTEDSEGLGR